MYKYKAIGDGVLSDPYRRVKKGDVVSVQEPLEASWMVPLEEHKPEPDLPIVPHMNIKKNAPKANDIPPTPVSDGYSNQMDSIKAKEAVEDGEAESFDDAMKEIKPNKFVGEAVLHPKETTEAPDEDADEVQEGTGSQDVLG